MVGHRTGSSGGQPDHKMNYLPYCPTLPPGFVYLSGRGTQSFLVRLIYGACQQTRECDDWLTACAHKTEALTYGGESYIMNRAGQVIG